MSYGRDNTITQNLNRHMLLDNGYTPLANTDKRCMLKGWSTLEVTHEYIEDNWEGRRTYMATGLRLEDRLCAIDVDIDGQDLVAQIWDRAVEKVPLLSEALLRFGKGSKELWLVRVSKTFGVAYSKAHNDPADPDESSQRVEIFGGDHPRQFGCFGAHTMGDNGEPLIEYEWDEGSPLDTPINLLPVLSQADVTEIIEIANDVLAASGWPEAEGWGSGMSTGETIYDLTEDMVFDCEDGIERSLIELSAWADTGGTCRCSASWLDGQRHSNKTRCLVSITHDGDVAVLEMGNWERHLPADAEINNAPLEERFSDLAEALKGRDYGLPDDLEDAPQSFRDRVNYLLENWAYCAERVRCALPVLAPEEHSCTMAGLRGLEARFGFTKIGPKGGEKLVNPADVWYAHASRMDCNGYRFLPDREQGLHERDGEVFINSFEPIVHGDLGPNVAKHREIWDQFLTHLLPVDEEREWFKDWLAHKAQHPEVPAVAVLMTTPTHGVGRGSLFQIMQGLFRNRYCRTVPSSLLTGNEGQSAYTDWMAETLFIFADEVLPDGDASSSMEWKRKKTYERLKERIDPKARVVTIVRKGLPNYRETVHATYLMATNHHNAIPMGPADRRIAVLTNGRVALMAARSVYEALNSVRDPEVDASFLSTLWNDLRLRDVSNFSPFTAPLFAGRSDMIDANQTELDTIVNGVLETMPHDVCTIGGLRERVRMELVRQDLLHEFKGWRNHCTDYAYTAWVRVPQRLANSRGTKHHYIARTEEAAEALAKASFLQRDIYVRDSDDHNMTASTATLARRLGISTV